MFCIFTYICLHGWLNFVRHVREYTKWALIQLQVGAHNSASRRSAKINFWAEAVRLFGSGAKKVWTDQGWAWHCNHAKLTRIEFGWEVGIIIASLMRKARQKQRMRFVMISKKSDWLGWHDNPRPECSTGGNTATGELLPFTERRSRQDERRKWRLLPQVPRNLWAEAKLWVHSWWFLHSKTYCKQTTTVLKNKINVWHIYTTYMDGDFLFAKLVGL